MSILESFALDRYAEWITTDQYGTLQVELPEQADRFAVARDFGEAGFDVLLRARKPHVLTLRPVSDEAHAFASSWPIYAYMAVRSLCTKRLPPEEYLPEGMLPVYERDSGSGTFSWQGAVAFFAATQDRTEEGVVFHIGRTRWREVGDRGLVPVRVDRWVEEGP